MSPEIVLNSDWRPGGYPFLISRSMNIFGDSQKAAFFLNCFLGGLSALLIFIIAYLLFENAGIGLWSAFIFSLLPQHLKYSGSAASDISSLFFVCLGISAVILYFKSRGNLPLLYAGGLIVLFAGYIRPENIILFFFYIAVLFNEFKAGRLRKKEFFLSFFFFAIITLPLIKQIPFIIHQEKVSSGGSFWSFAYFLRNIFDNFKYIFSARFNLSAVSIFSLIGSIILFRKKTSIFYVLFIWFGFFFFIYTCFFSGTFSPSATADSERHFLPCAVPLSLFAAYAINVVLDYLKKSRLIFFISIIAACLMIIANSFFVTKTLIGMTRQRDTFREYAFIKDSLGRLPDNLYILSYDPAYIISAFSRKAIALDIFFETKDFPRQIILLEGYSWYAHIDQSMEYERLLKKIYNFDFSEAEKSGLSLYGKYKFLRLSLREEYGTP